MVNEILTAAGVPHKPARFPDPPTTTYAVYFDSKAAGGADGYNLVFTHDATVELYAPVIDEEAATALESELDARGLDYERQGWYWLDSIKRYQDIYEFTYIEKRRA